MTASPCHSHRARASSASYFAPFSHYAARRRRPAVDLAGLSWRFACAGAVIMLAVAPRPVLSAPPGASAAGFPLPLIERFENFGEKDGLPGHKVSCVLKTSDGELWLGTDNGLCLRQPSGQFRRFGPEQGLSHRMVLSLAEDPQSGDLWIATMRGLDRFSGGRLAAFTQTDSGLPNNVVYAVAVAENTVWAATAAGAGAYDLKTRTWKLYDQNNSIMREPWCYSIATGNSVVYIGVWGGGIVEHDPRTGSFKEHRDPDGDEQYDLAPDDGPINDITSWVACEAGILWQATYFGLSRYDTATGRWQTWVQDKTPLVSNFVNFVFARRRVAWTATDRGISITDGVNWVNYLVGDNGQGIVKIFRPGEKLETRAMATALANRFVLGVWADDREAWIGTSNGLSHGFLDSFASSATAVTHGEADHRACLRKGGQDCPLHLH